MDKVIFLDRDWTINKLLDDKEYVDNYEKVELLSYVKKVLSKAKKKWYKLVVVTNQTWVWAWYYTKEQAELINKKIEKLLWFKFDAIYSCYHHPDEKCSCRKPEIWLFLEALKDFNVDLSSSYMIWDKEKDVLAWKKIWLKTIILWKSDLADFEVSDWLEVEKIVL